MKSILLVLSLLSFFCCSTPTTKDYTQKKCVDTFHDQDLGIGIKLINQITRGATQSTSYLLTGLGYTTDFAIIFTGSVGIGIVVCSPIIAIEAGAKGNGSASFQCVEAVTQGMAQNLNLKNVGIGKKIYQKTEKWRCPDIDHVSEGLRRVADCHYKKGDIVSAQKQLEVVLSDSVLSRCVSSKEKQKTKALLWKILQEDKL